MKLQRRVARLFTTISTTIPEFERLYNHSISNEAIKQTHARLIRIHLHTDPSTMLDVVRSYALSPTTMQKAHIAFSQIEQPTSLIWNYMIRELSLAGRLLEAIQTCDEMRNQGFHGNHLTLIFVFKACSGVSDLFHGRKSHVHVVKHGFGSHLYVCNALLHMYASCGEIGVAKKLFVEMSERDLVSWNSLICGYSRGSRFREVLSLFNSMRAENVKADAVTMVKVILACSHLGEMNLADSAVKYIEDNHVTVDVYLGNTLIDMYGRQRNVGLAREVFDGMAERNIVSWNTMIIGHAKAGDLISARKLFDEMPQRDVVSWTSMITGYSQANQFSDAVRLFREMMVAQVKPDKITIASVLSACAHLSMLDFGKFIHNFIQKHNIEADIYVGNSLIDMYCKCGSVEKALEVFQEMKERDSVSWTSVISGLAVNGFASYALDLFSQMLKGGVRPTHGTFVGILLACAHAGLVDEGLQYIQSMERDHGLVPEIKHYGCVVDLLSRSGRLDQAHEFINQLPLVPDVVLWRTLLNACKLHGNMVLAEIVTNKLLELDPGNGGNYVLSSNNYAIADRWDDSIKMRNLMAKGDVQKPSGWSSIEVTGETFSKSMEHSRLKFET